ncbi:MAG: glycosyltransferase 87 family protein [Actinomycetota bacterium]|nr:glycosyltransferase 87 family protein [Actinomycetota bacterium]MDH5223388.1 glycosyltransferase 87 family protein [Actinomycetota bacterium]MDH5312540.1 glycosyltransferase 87 family protein [Actinomycetota bacterium]
MSRRARGVTSLGLVLACVLGTMALGAMSKAPCASGQWSDLRQYRLLCYTDVVPLLDTEQLRGARLPFLDECTPVEGQNCDEYPVVAMYVMRAAAWISGDDYTPFYWVNALLLTGFAVAIAVMLYVANGSRALYFALAPTLLVYGTVNWDLVAVALSTMGLLAFFRRRDRAAGVALGLGAATKLYPALLVVPLLAERMRERRPDGAIVLGWTTVGTWLVANLPFAVIAPTAWLTFFRFNGERGADFDSLWYIACRHTEICPTTRVINVASFGVFLAVAAAVWAIKVRRHPDFARWTLGLPVLVAFLLSNKVYSPQYGLWLLPWFALALPRLWIFIAFSLTDVAVFATRFTWFGRLQGAPGASQELFEVMVLLRAAVLVWCVVSWIRRPPEPIEIERRAIDARRVPRTEAVPS